MNDLSLARLGLAEHAYPTPTRGLLSEQQRRKPAKSVKGGEVRFGIRLPSGTEVMALTDSEVAERERQDAANLAYDTAERKRRNLEALEKLGNLGISDHWSTGQ